MRAVLTGLAVMSLVMVMAGRAFSAEGRTMVPVMYTCPLTAKLRITQQFEFVDVPEGWRAFGTSESSIETVWQFDHISSAGRIFCVYRRGAADGTEIRHVYERDWPQGYTCQTDEVQSNAAICRPVKPGRAEQTGR